MQSSLDDLFDERIKKNTNDVNKCHPKFIFPLLTIGYIGGLLFAFYYLSNH